MPKIMQINAFTRNVEKIHDNMDCIDSNEFDHESIKKCCTGLIPYYGGKYSTQGLIWRYLRDFPYLKPNFDFNDDKKLMSNFNREEEIGLEFARNDHDLSSFKVYDIPPLKNKNIISFKQIKSKGFVGL